jgi:hypothetical protein
MAQEPQSGSAMWLYSLAAMLGILVVLSAFTFFYAEGTSYLSDDPRAASYEPQI